MENKEIINFISLAEAAKLTNYSQDYISLLCRQGKMKGKKLGRNWFTTKEWVEDYINKTNGSGQNIISVRINPSSENSGFSEVCSNQKIRFVFKGMVLSALAVSFISISFLIYQNSFANIFFENSKTLSEVITDNAEEKNPAQKISTEEDVKGIIAGAKTSIEAEREKKGLVIIPPVDGVDSRELIEKINSSFSGYVDVMPSEDGISGVMYPKNKPEEGYLYFMVSINEE